MRKISGNKVGDKIAGVTLLYFRACAERLNPITFTSVRVL